jgi:tRNA 2-thiouridine synthesizing protein A
MTPPNALDCTGLICPLPVLRARKALTALASGDLLRVTATDPAAPRDFVAFCAATGHILVDSVAEGDVFTFLIRKAG